MVVLARPLLHLMGARYADASTGALRLLAIGLIPYAVIQSYNSVCRVRSRLREAIAVNAVLGVALCTVTVSVARHGPTAMASRVADLPQRRRGRGRSPRDPSRQGSDRT